MLAQRQGKSVSSQSVVLTASLMHGRAQEGTRSSWAEATATRPAAMVAEYFILMEEVGSGRCVLGLLGEIEEATSVGCFSCLVTERV